MLPCSSIHFAIDRYHLHTAIEVGCDYLVTNDSGFRTRVQTLISKKIIVEPIKMTSAQGFLSIIAKKARSKDLTVSVLLMEETLSIYGFGIRREPELKGAQCDR